MHVKISSFILLGLALWTAPRVSGQSTLFTYQGRLSTSASLANGNYDLVLTIYDAVNAVNVVSGPVTNSPFAVTNGIFITTLDFAADHFPCATRLLAIRFG